MSPATDGFSAIINALPIYSNDTYTLSANGATPCKRRERGPNPSPCQRFLGQTAVPGCILEPQPIPPGLGSQIRSPKPEARNKSEIQSPKSQTSAHRREGRPGVTARLPAEVA